LHSSFVVALLEPLQTQLDKESSCAHETKSSDSTQSSCSSGQKRGRLTVIPHCYAERILQKNGEAVGVVGVVKEFDNTDTGAFRKPALRSVKLVVRDYCDLIIFLNLLILTYFFKMT
jgi:hypothetical protein